MKEGFVILENTLLPSEFDSISKVEGIIDAICKTLNVSEDYYGNVLVAVTEAVNNAIEHGNKLNSSVMFTLSAAHSESVFCFNVCDVGNGFNYQDLPDPTNPENIFKENGRGVFLMRSLSDDVEFEDGGRSVTVYFNK